jgi:(2R)-phospho-3-sulfolactate synthase (ComA)
MIESEGITENADPWRTDVAARIMKQVGMEKVMFEAADPPVFEWYIKNYGIDVNLFIDHSQIVQLECLRRGIWGTKSTFDGPPRHDRGSCRGYDARPPEGFEARLNQTLRHVARPLRLATGAGCAKKAGSYSTPAGDATI